MSIIPKNTLYDWFKTKKKPTQEQFWGWMDSYWHKGELIPLNQIADINAILQQTVSIDAFNAHLSDDNAHVLYLAKTDASNLNPDNILQWKSALGVGTLPSNIATVDDATQAGNVYTKIQSDDLFMAISDFVLSNGKIRSDKIDALGLTELISVTETSLAAFMSNNANYTYEKNDMIAIPDGSGNYSLYIYKGGTKTVAGNYIATGLSNITIGMVQGLQTALDAKMSKPVTDGSYLAKTASGVTTWQAINPTAMYLTHWNNGNFVASPIYTDGTKMGVGTTSPTEMLHLNNGRIRSKANVLDENNETLLNQITTYNRKLLFTDSTGTKKTVLTVEDLPTEFMALPSKLSDTQKTNWKTEMNGGWTTATMSISAILPSVTPLQNADTYITLRGANLNFNPANFSVKILNSSGTVVADVPNSQVTLVSGTELSLYFNFFSLGVGNYKIRLNNGVAIYDTQISILISDSISQIAIGSTTWGEKSYNNFDSPLQSVSGGSIHFKVDANQKPLADENEILYKIKALDNLVFSNSENFYVEINLSYINITSQAPSGVSVILANNADLNLNDDSLAVIKLRGYGGGTGAVDLYGSLVSDYYNGANLNLRITKQGDQLSISFKTINPAMLPREGVYNTSIINTSDLHLGFAFGNKNNASAECNVNIVTAYKF